MRISDWSSDVCSSDLLRQPAGPEDEAGDLGDALLGLQVGEDEGPLAAHLFRIAVHHFQRRADQRREIDLVDHQQVRSSEEHTSELQSLMRTSYAVFCLKKTKSPPTISMTATCYSTINTRHVKSI